MATLLTTLILAGCGGPKNADELGGGLHITLEENSAAREALEGFQRLFEPPLSVFTPSTTADFNCFAVNVTGPGVSPTNTPTNCTTSNNYNGKGPGVFSNTAARGTPLVVSVPSGNNRNIDVYGITPATSSCGGSSSGGSESGYLLGRTGVNVSADAAVTIPITFVSGTAASVSCTSSGGGSGTPASLLLGGRSSGCSTYGGPAPTTPAPTTTAMGTAYSGGEISELASDNGTMVLTESSCSPSGQWVLAEFQFDTSSFTLSNYSTVNVTWKGRAGEYIGSCVGSAGTTFSPITAQVYIYRYNLGTSPSWEQIGSNVTATTGTQTVTGSASNPTDLAYNAGGRIIVRVTSGATSSSTRCAAIYTDFVSVALQ